MTCYYVSAPVAAEILGGLYRYDPVALTWTLLSGLAGPYPQPRTSCEMVEVGGQLYLFGGYTDAGLPPAPPGGDDRAAHAGAAQGTTRRSWATCGALLPGPVRGPTCRAHRPYTTPAPGPIMASCLPGRQSISSGAPASKVRGGVLLFSATVINLRCTQRCMHPDIWGHYSNNDDELRCGIFYGVFHATPHLNTFFSAVS